MKLVIDDQLPPALAEAARRAGIDARHVSELGLSGAADGAIWKRACSDGMAIVTKDRDYVGLLAARPPHAPVLWVRIGNARNRQLIGHLVPQLLASLVPLSEGVMLIELI